EGLSVPLIRAVEATRGGTKVRVWSNPGDRFKVSGGLWEELPTEIVPERDSLPAFVLRGGLESPLSLQRHSVSTPLLATAVIGRGLIHVVVGPDGRRTYRVRHRLDKLNARVLDLQIPVSPAGLG